jgi:preprotein translocase subunit SecE
MSRLVDYIRDTKGEMKHVSWPTRTQSVLFTILVIIISIATAYYLGFFDFIFNKALELII